MPGAAPLRWVFFDVGGTLGRVVAEPGNLRLEPFASSLPLLEMMRSTLGLRIGVLSNTPDGMSTQEFCDLLDRAGLLTLLDPEAIVTSQDAGVSKPDQRIYAYAAEQVGVLTGQCLYVGENLAEVEGAQRAGMAGLVKPAAVATS
jgi:FMN phosphatase YigB (HAD superfamily)